MEKYYGFENVEDVIQNFEITENDIKDEEVIVAVYDYGSYEGSAFVLFQRDGKLFEVHGGHCSCYGLEDQWEPEETTWEALDMRKSFAFDDELAEIKAIIKNRGTL